MRNDHSNNLWKKQKSLKSLTAILLALLLTFGLIPPLEVLAAEYSADLPLPVATSSVGDSQSPTALSEDRLQALEELRLERGNRGVIGFEGAYALTDDHTPTRVIVVFEHSPAAVQVVEAREDGYVLPRALAEQIVEDDHAVFRQELAALFGALPMPFGTQGHYTITAEYRRALNGVAMTLPANMVAEIANFSSVRAVFPDYYVQEPKPVQDVLGFYGNPSGMAPGRATMGADILHEMGYRGEGILIAVLDTGIDWHHPAFAGTFPTIEEMQARGVAVTNAHGINIEGTYYYLGRDFVGYWPGQAWRGNPSPFDPMETSPINFPTASNFTNHGTHVSGTIVGQPVGTNPEQAILGVAPGARAIHYRVLWGSTPVSVINMGIEQTYYDRPDIVNMSLGGGNGDAVDLQGIAINNIMLANPDITFVIAVGNNGPGYNTLGNPGAATLAIGVGNAIDGYRGLTLSSGALDANAVFAYGETRIGRQWVFDAGYDAYISTFPTLPHYNGYYRIFALPLTPASATQADGIGTGEPADFDALVAAYGLPALQGSFVLLRRGSYLPDVANRAYDLGLGGVISVNSPGQDIIIGTGLPGDQYIPLFMLYNAPGLQLRDVIAAATSDYALIRFPSVYGEEVSMGGNSSRGPVGTSYEIKPDILAHGTGVFSAVPWWEVGQTYPNIDYSVAYLFNSGTSMAAPHVAGAVALMLQYSRANMATQWTSEEIKARLMNTAVPLPGGYGIFEGGAGMTNVYAAINAHSIVYVNYPHVATVPGWTLGAQPTAYARTGSFSFGLINPFEADETGFVSESLTATIVNQGSASHTYTIEATFITTGRNSQVGGATLTFSTTTVTAPAGGSADFTATLNIPTTAADGHYEGYVIVRSGSEQIASLPFASVVRYNTPPLSNAFLYRPTMATNPITAPSDLSRQLGMFFTPHSGFLIRGWVMRDIDGVNEYNWMLPAYDHALVGFTGLRTAWEEGLTMGEQHRAVIFDGYYMERHPIPGFPELPLMRLTEEGDYFFVLEVFRQLTPTGGWAWDSDILLPFSIDNTPPEFTALTINGNNVDLGYFTPTIALTPFDSPIAAFNLEDIEITGNVYDAWLANAISEGRTFDIWQEGAAFGPQACFSNNLALWVIAGENTPDNHPVRAEIDPSGNFSLTLPDVYIDDYVYLTFWLVDNYSVVPRSDSYVGADTLTWPAPDYVTTWYWAAYDHFQDTNWLVTVDPALSAYLNTGALWGATLPHDFVWSGHNVMELTVRVTDDGADLVFVPVEDIIDVPEVWAVGVPLNLDAAATVVPVNATNRSIVWTVEDFDFSPSALRAPLALSGILFETQSSDMYVGEFARGEAPTQSRSMLPAFTPFDTNLFTLDDGILTAVEPGEITVLATIYGGILENGETAVFTKEFTITFEPPPLLLEDVVLYRSVMTTGANAMNLASRELGIFYRPMGGFLFTTHVFQYQTGIDETNWNTPEFAGARLGRTRNQFLVGNPHSLAAIGQDHRGIIFDGWVADDSTSPVTYFNYLPEGDYLLIMEVFYVGREHIIDSVLQGSLPWAHDILLPFSVDNTPPVIDAVTVDGDSITTADSQGRMLVTLDEYIVISGNVNDVWTNQAAARGQTNDVWLAGAPHGPEINMENNVAVWVLVGSNAPANRPVRAYFDQNGDFTVNWPTDNVSLPSEITIWAVDGWSPMPFQDGWIGNWMTDTMVSTNTPRPWQLLPVSDDFMPNGHMWIDLDLEGGDYLRTGQRWGEQGTPVNEFYVWTGVNVTSESITIWDGTYSFLRDVYVHRPVISTGPYAMHAASRQIVINYTRMEGFSMRSWLVRDVPGINEDNWNSPEFAHAWMGLNNWRFFPTGFMDNVINESRRGVLFDGTFLPSTSFANSLEAHPAPGHSLLSAPRTSLQEEGNFIIVMELFRQTDPDLSITDFEWVENMLIRFAVDNTPPQFTELMINDTVVNIAEPLVSINRTGTSDIVITGNVYDAWLNQAIADGVTFDVWNHGAPHGPSLSPSNNLALWALVGELPPSWMTWDPDIWPVRVDVDARGDFAITFTDALEYPHVDITLWLIDGYSVTPFLNQNPMGILTATDFAPPLQQHFAGLQFMADFDMSGLLGVSNDLIPFIVPAGSRMQGPGPSPPAGQFNQFNWSGLNMVEHVIRVTYDGVFVPVAEIVGVPERWVVNEPLNLNFASTILPSDATNTDIVWEIVSEFSPATIVDGIFTATVAIPTPIVIRAIVANGIIEGDGFGDFVQEFSIQIYPAQAALLFSGNSGYVLPVDGNPAPNHMMIVQNGQTVGANLPSAERDGYTFLGWNTVPDGTGKGFDGDTIFFATATGLMVFAVWEEIIIETTVTEVTISPATATVIQGSTQQFTATVTGTNNPPTDVTWTVSGHLDATIDQAGLLTVGLNVPDGTILTVTATSVFNLLVSGAASVTVIYDPDCPPYCDCPICEPYCLPDCDCPACAYLAWRAAVEQAQREYEEWRAWLTAVEQAQREYEEWRAWLAAVEQAQREYEEWRAWLAAVEQAQREYEEWRAWLCATGQCGGCHLCD